MNKNMNDKTLTCEHESANFAQRIGNWLINRSIAKQEKLARESWEYKE